MDYNQAYERVSQLKKFYRSLTVFGIVAVILFFNDCFERGKIDWSSFDTSIILVMWGIILAVKAVKLFIFNSDWERKVLEEELKKTKKPINF